MNRNYELLKDVLSVPTQTYKEEYMIQFIVDFLRKNNIPFEMDKQYNIYATKQTDENIDFFPCVISHTDTVHKIDTINVREEMFSATNPFAGIAVMASIIERIPAASGVSIPIMVRLPPRAASADFKSAVIQDPYDGGIKTTGPLYVLNSSARVLPFMLSSKFTNFRIFVDCQSRQALITDTRWSFRNSDS